MDSLFELSAEVISKRPNVLQDICEFRVRYVFGKIRVYFGRALVKEGLKSAEDFFVRLAISSAKNELGGQEKCLNFFKEPVEGAMHDEGNVPDIVS